MTANPQLAELCFTPAIHFTFIRDCERVEATGRDKRNLFTMEKFDEAWHRSDFNWLGQAKLALKAATPSIQVTFIC